MNRENAEGKLSKFSLTPNNFSYSVTVVLISILILIRHGHIPTQRLAMLITLLLPLEIGNRKTLKSNSSILQQTVGQPEHHTHNVPERKFIFHFI